MFTNEQIMFMKSLRLNLNFSNLSDDEWCTIEEVVGDKYTLFSLNENGEPNADGLMCISILDKLP